MIDPANPTMGVNPMQQFQGPMDPQTQAAFLQLMMLLGGLGQAVPPQPQPQGSQMPPLLGGQRGY